MQRIPAIKTLTVEGARITDVVSFYEEINRVFMSVEDWSLGESLDALDDMLRGGYGAIAGTEDIRLLWKDIDVACAALGLDATRRHLHAKLDRPEVFSKQLIERQLVELDSGTGKTYFDIVIEIIAGHPNITLVRA